MGRSDKARALLEDIAKTMASDLWLSTHETSFGLMALAVYYGSAEVKPFRYRFAWDAEKAVDVESATPFDRREFPGFPVKGRTLVVTNTEASRSMSTSIGGACPRRASKRRRQRGSRSTSACAT